MHDRGRLLPGGTATDRGGLVPRDPCLGSGPANGGLPQGRRTPPVVARPGDRNGRGVRAGRARVLSDGPTWSGPELSAGIVPGGIGRRGLALRYAGETSRMAPKPDGDRTRPHVAG